MTTWYYTLSSNDLAGDASEMISSELFHMLGGHFCEAGARKSGSFGGTFRNKSWRYGGWDTKKKRLGSPTDNWPLTNLLKNPPLPFDTYQFKATSWRHIDTCHSMNVTVTAFSGYFHLCLPSKWTEPRNIDMLPWSWSKYLLPGTFAQNAPHSWGKGNGGNGPWVLGWCCPTNAMKLDDTRNGPTVRIMTF